MPKIAVEKQCQKSHHRSFKREMGTKIANEVVFLRRDVTINISRVPISVENVPIIRGADSRGASLQRADSTGAGAF